MVFNWVAHAAKVMLWCIVMYTIKSIIEEVLVCFAFAKANS
ncbi:hypothetical protein NMS_2401 [Nonlabens marinus S1-08]|uniref:Uncharacterized protein n=1 Tax=Nonlabens marinus S1-08 TaxID=1454201 RepID=W8VSQ3_9FLAO|nr:hypothetical protein NMS_2401 [Nonlabens marinus S1-08]